MHRRGRVGPRYREGDGVVWARSGRALFVAHVLCCGRVASAAAGRGKAARTRALRQKGARAAARRRERQRSGAIGGQVGNRGAVAPAFCVIRQARG